MADKTKAPIALVNFTEKGPQTTSLKIAEVFSIDHKNVLRMIRGLKCSPKFSQLNFEPAKYQDAQNKTRPMFNVTKDGLVVLAGKMNTAEGDALTERYIAAFNFMADRSTDNLIAEANAACRDLKRINESGSAAGAALGALAKKRKAATKLVEELGAQIQGCFAGPGFEIAQALEGEHQRKAKKKAKKPEPVAESPNRTRSTAPHINEASQPSDTNGDPLLSREQEGAA